MRSCLLGLSLVIAVGAFLPDTSHLYADNVEHDAEPHSHDETGSEVASDIDDLETQHCHNGVSCTGAIATRNQLAPTTIYLQVSQAFVQGDVVNNSPMLWRDPPVPIETA